MQTMSQVVVYEFAQPAPWPKLTPTALKMTRLTTLETARRVPTVTLPTMMPTNAGALGLSVLLGQLQSQQTQMTTV